MRLVRTTRWPKLPRGPLLALSLFLLLVAFNEAAGWWTGRGGVVLCTFRRLTGYPCPGCGSTRMVLALLHGHFAQAATLNPLAFVLLLAGIVLLLVRAIFQYKVDWITSPRARRVWTWALVISIAANWAYVIARGN